MIVFYLACAALMCLAALFLVLPLAGRHRPVDNDAAEANLQWYRLRRQELEGEAEALDADAQLRLLEDTAAANASPGMAPVHTRFRAWLLVPLVGVFAAVLYYKTGAAPDVVIAQQIQGLDANSTPEQMHTLIAAIQQRAEQRPGNLDYTVMLGQFAMQSQDYAAAARYYDALSAAAPGDATALAYAAQASYLAAGRTLTDAARLRAERALSIDPHQRTALGLLGMVSFEQGQYRAAINYWERLLAVETPGSDSYKMIASVIDSARDRLGEPAATGQAQAGAQLAADDAAPAVPGVGVTVSVALPEGTDIDPRATVFILAKNGDGSSRMPIAVQRLSAGDLPVTLRLDDGNSMAGQKLSGVASVLVEVQVSPDGRPGAANASWLGRAGPLAPSASTDPVTVTLESNPGG